MIPAPTSTLEAAWALIKEQQAEIDRLNAANLADCLRDQVARAALVAILSNPDRADGERAATKLAFSYADAFMEARGK